MSNRTDWPELVKELQQVFKLDGVESFWIRVETELHNAHVAGQEENLDKTTEIDLITLRKLISDSSSKYYRLLTRLDEFKHMVDYSVKSLGDNFEYNYNKWKKEKGV